MFNKRADGRPEVNHLYYLRTRYYIESLGGSTGLSFRISGYEEANVTDGSFSWGNVAIFKEVDKWAYGQAIIKSPNILTDAKYGGLRIGGDNSGKDGSLEYYISHIMVVDLTATFGAGNEPPLWWCNMYIPWKDETAAYSAKKTVQWFPEASMSRLDTAFDDGIKGYYHDGDNGYYSASDYRENDATVDTNGNVTVSGTPHVNSTTLNNP